MLPQEGAASCLMKVALVQRRCERLSISILEELLYGRVCDSLHLYHLYRLETVHYGLSFHARVIATTSFADIHSLPVPI